MKIGIIGGTGGMGEGFALRWCKKHDVIIGSRDKNKASDVANNYTKTAKEYYGELMKGSIAGDDNFELSKYSDVLFLSIPYESINETCNRLSGQIKDNCIIVCPIVPMARDEKGFTYICFEQGKKSAGELVANNFKSRSNIVSAFHTISEVKLKKIDHGLDADTFICGDDENTIKVINELISEISGLRPIYLGPLSLSYQAEALTPMLLNSAKRNKMKNPAIKLV
jgi:NADPH-dependent F420 reductase